MSATRLVLILAILATLGIGAFIIQSNNDLKDLTENNDASDGSSASNSTSNAVPAPGVNPDDIQEMIVENETEGENNEPDAVAEGEGATSDAILPPILSVSSLSLIPTLVIAPQPLRLAQEMLSGL